MRNDRSDQRPCVDVQRNASRREALKRLAAGALLVFVGLPATAEAQGAGGCILGVQVAGLVVSGDSQLQGLSVKRTGELVPITLTIETSGEGSGSVFWAIS